LLEFKPVLQDGLFYVDAFALEAPGWSRGGCRVKGGDGMTREKNRLLEAERKFLAMQPE
jgi:hypothetical protein